MTPKESKLANKSKEFIGRRVKDFLNAGLSFDTVLTDGLTIRPEDLGEEILNVKVHREGARLVVDLKTVFW